MDRLDELAYYRRLYVDEDARYGYPGSGRIETAYRLVESLVLTLNNADTLLDVSAGRGQFVRSIATRFPDLGVHVSEGVSELLDSDLQGFPRFTWVLPEPCPLDGMWDVVTCLDVLEHLVPEDTVPALEAMADVAAQRLVLSIALFSCPWKVGEDRRETHINLRTHDEWEHLLRHELPALRVAHAAEAEGWSWFVLER
jgi:hypothetical protein